MTKLNDKIAFALNNVEAAKKSRPKTTSAKRSNTNYNTKLEFEIYEDDDTPIKILKEEINKRNLTRGDIHEFCKRLEKNKSHLRAKAYNLIYGLNKRGSITTETYTIWLEFLDVDIVLKPRRK